MFELIENRSLNSLNITIIFNFQEGIKVTLYKRITNSSIPKFTIES